jgi:hypothetical protein
MSLPFEIGGAATVVPGVYSTFSVASSLPSAVAAGRSVFILGEAEEGVPGSLLDLKLNFFTDFSSVQDFYKSGAIVDAARQLFSNQPSQVFSGAIQRLYIYKTNESTRASKAISSPSNYGSLVASRYGEAGNKIKTQIKTGQAESKPTKTILYLPSPAVRTFRVGINGAVTGSLTVAANGKADAFVTALAGVTGLSATGGTVRTVNVASLTVDMSASGDTLTLTKASGAGDFGTAAQVGDVAYIRPGVAIAGGADENAGAYLVTAWSTTSVSLKQLKATPASAEANAAAFDTSTGIVLATGELAVNAPVVLAVSATTATGAAASMELLENSSDKLAAGMIYQDSTFGNLLVDSTSSLAKITATVPSAGKLTLSLNTGSWTSIPAAGDLIRIGRGSLLAGAGNLNVGTMIVESATSQTITASHLFSGMTTQAVAQVSLNGTNNPFTYAAGFVTTSLAAKRIDSAAERKVSVDASRSSDGASFPSTNIGGNVALEIGYTHASATACTVSIDALRVMTINVTGPGLSDLTVNLKKYATLQDLASFLNTQANITAKIPDAKNKTLPTSALDAVSSVGMLSAGTLASNTGKIKKDYYDWKTFFANNFGLLSFQEGSMSLKAGLPAAEATASFLTGATLGATSSASIQAGFDAGLKIAVRHVIPLFSRDAQKDIDDGLTDSGSTYSIDSINAAAKAHVATASSSLMRKERFAMVSFDGSFNDAKQKASDLGYERMQMCFERHSATAGDGTLRTFLPWMACCAIAAGRSQAVLGTSMLRKPFNLASASHVGDMSLYTDTLTQDFDPEDRGQLEDAINYGLVVLRSVPGFGVRMESPDLSTRSRTNDPQGWVWERVNVLFTCDEVLDACRNVLENYTGERTSDVPTAVVKSSLNDTLSTFKVGTGNGSLLAYKVVSVTSSGNAYAAKVSITPTEALEAITLDVTAERSI